MAEVAGVLLKNRKRLTEIADVLVRHGLAEWAARGAAIADVGPVATLVQRAVTPGQIEASQGERLRGVLTELGTTYIKFGQMLSMRPDVVGNDVAEELTKLQATVPPDPQGVACMAVERQLGESVADLFGSFDSVPFASGSVAQVHRATLADGTSVAVKVVHDGIADKVRADVELMQAIAEYLEAEDPQLAELRPSVLMAEFSTMIDAAIDLRQELENLRMFRSNFADETDIVIPKPYPELSGEKVLTMAMISGSAFSDRASVESAGWGVEALVRRAANVYLEMIFRDGLYHADPHPGNFLLPDGDHLALLDFGDVGRVGSQRRHQLESMVIAVGLRDVDSLVDVIWEMTTPPVEVDRQAMRTAVEMWLNRYLLVGVGHLDMNGIFTSGMQILHRFHLVLPADLALLFRVVVSLQGLGRQVQTEVRVTEMLQPYLGRIMAQRFDPRHIARQVSRSARTWDHFLAGLPDELQAILDQARTGKVGIEFRVHDADHAVDRLVDGLVTSAALLAGAELISRRADPMVGPFSVPGLAAAAAGALTWQRLVARRKPAQSWLARARKLAEFVRQ